MMDPDLEALIALKRINDHNITLLTYFQPKKSLRALIGCVLILWGCKIANRAMPKDKTK